MFLKTKLFFVFTLCAFLAFGQKAPKYSNEFLSIGVGARSLGMANSCIATINDVNSSYWNPAGLTMINDDLELGLMHSEYFAGIAKYDYLGSAFKLKDSASMAVSIIRFGVDNIPNTLELIDNEGNVRYDRIKSFSVADYAFLISYAKKAKIAGLRYGANVKIIRRKAGDFASAWGFGLDAGLIAPVPDSYFPEIAPRPRDTSFDTSKMENELGVKPIGIKEGLLRMKSESTDQSMREIQK